ncbi:MAG: hypothetical protein JXX14_14550 [Deltaproteobacteria bacterium]|nr:hypothetical protein [Deltaproteobacteria bacterium]
MKKIYVSVLMSAVTILLASCGVKRYEEPERCDDLSTVFYTDVAPESWSAAQRRAVNRYTALDGNWDVTMSCPGKDAMQTHLSIRETLASNVEMYEGVEDADCDYFGKAVFEATITGSGDLDLDDVTFFLTADLLRSEDAGDNIVEASTEDLLSQYEDINSFALNVIVDADGIPRANKQITMISDDAFSVSVSRTSGCEFSDWVAQ